MENTCKTCGKDANGYKCADCGSETESHDPQHQCGEGRCMPKCAECSEAESNCTCPAPAPAQ